MKYYITLQEDRNKRLCNQSMKKEWTCDLTVFRYQNWWCHTCTLGIWSFISHIIVVHILIVFSTIKYIYNYNYILYIKYIIYFIWSENLWEECRRLPNQSENDLRNYGRITSLPFIVVRFGARLKVLGLKVCLG